MVYMGVYTGCRALSRKSGFKFQNLDYIIRQIKFIIRWFANILFVFYQWDKIYTRLWDSKTFLRFISEPFQLLFTSMLFIIMIILFGTYSEVGAGTEQSV
jgi:hypothetical protein